MTVYLGRLGQMVPVECGAEQVSAAPRHQFESSLEGRVFAQVIPEARRAWQLRIGVASALGTLSDFVSGAWGAGPFVWVSDEASAGNVLTPAQAGFTEVPADMVLAGPRRDSDGVWAAQSLRSTYSGAAGARVLSDVPVVSGVPVTASLDVSRVPAGAAPRIVLRTVTATGGFHQSVVATGDAVDGMQRVSATLVPDDLVVSARLYIMSDVEFLMRPQITWTASPVPFHPGAGCAQAVVDDLSSTVLSAVRGQRVLSDVSYMVQEVG